MQPIHRRSLIAVVLLLFALAAPAQGRPTLAAAGSAAQTAPPPNDQYWDTQFLPPGVDGTVYAILVNGNDVYVGGEFWTAGGLQVRGLARWDGARWHAVGEGAPGRPASMQRVYDLVFDNGTLYVATQATGIRGSASNPEVATWDGERWGVLGAGANYLSGGVIVDVQSYGGDLYAAGSFSINDAPDGSNIARWDGGAWRSIGGLGPFNGSQLPESAPVQALTVYQGALIAAGYFRANNGAPANALARWDGGAWSQMGGLTLSSTAPILSVLASGGDLYVAGYFFGIGGVSARNVALWDGASWQALAQQASALPGEVTALAMRGGKLYAGGESLSYNGTGLAVWNGSEWRQEPGFAGRQVLAFAQNAAALYVGGKFKLGVSAYDSHLYDVGGIAQLAAEGWRPLGNGMPLAATPAPTALAAFNGTIYAVGGNQLLAWDRLRWTAIALPAGFSAPQYDQPIVASSAGVLLVGARDTISQQQIWRWDGRDWTPFGNPISGYVTELAADGATVYAAAYTTGSGPGVVMRWDGADWQTISTHVSAGTDATEINALAAGGGMLYAAGDFSRINSVEAVDMARWDGQRWTAFPAPGAPVRSIEHMVLQGDNLYLMGNQTALLHWDGGAWRANGPSSPGSPGGTISGGSWGWALASYDGQLVAASPAGGSAPAEVSRWDGAAWERLGTFAGSITGNDNSIGLLQAGNDLFAVGRFTTVNGAPSPFIARWNPVRLSTYLPWAAR